MKKKILSFAVALVMILQMVTVISAETEIIKIEAEAYAPGGQNVGYYDTTDGMLRPIEGYSGDVDLATSGTGIAVIFADTEWMKYELDIPEEGQYTLKVSYALARATTLPVIEIISGGGVVASAELEITSGANKYNEAEIGVLNLKEGKNEIKIKLNGTGINFDYFTLEYSGSYVSFMENENIVEAEEANENPIASEMDERTVVDSSALPISFTFNALNDGVYNVSLEALFDDASVTVSLNGVDSVSKGFAKEDNFSQKSIGNFQFAEGENVLTIDADGDIYLDKIYVNIIKGYDELESNGNVITVISTDYTDSLNTRTNTQITKSTDANGKKYMSFNENNWAEYEVSVPKSGIYGIVAYGAIAESYAYDYAQLDVYLNDSDETVTSGKVNKTSTWVDYKEGSLGGLYMEKGVNKIRIKVGRYATHFHKFTVEYLGDSFSLYSAYNGDNAVGTGSILPRGTSSILLYFSLSVNAGDIDEETIVLEGNEGVIPTEVKVEGNEVAVCLKKTLDYDSEYTLKVNGIGDIVNYFDLLDEKITFITGNDDITEGDSVSDVIASIEYDVVSVTGKMLSAEGVGIEGRIARLYDAGGRMLSETKTEADGYFEISYQLDENAPVGEHIFEVGGEYVAEKEEISLIYMSHAEENNLLSEWNGVSNGDDAEELIEKYKSGLGVSPDDDMKDITDSDAVYELLANESPKNAEELKKLYKQYIFIETVNQAESADAISKLIGDGEKLLVVGADKTKFDALNDNAKEKFFESLYICDVEKDKDKFDIMLEAELDKALAEQYGKKGLTLTADVNTSVYVGQGVEIPLGFNEERAGMIKVVFKLSGEGLSYIASPKAELCDEVFGKIDVSEEDDALMVIYIPRNSTVTVSDIGILSFLADKPQSGKDAIKLTIEAYAEYDEGLDCLIKETAEKKEAKITVSENNKKPSRDDSYVSGGGSSGSSSGGNGSGNAGGNTEPIKPADKPQKFEFSDIGNYAWAEESINTLLAKGVISESEDGKFNPQNNVKREEFVKMMVLALGIYDVDAKTSFNDVSDDTWYYSYIASAEKNGMINGDESGNFKVGKEISREEMTTIVWRMLEKLEFKSTDVYEAFDDHSQIADYAKNAVYSARAYGVVNGMGDNKFEPKGDVTRAQAAKMVYELMKMAGGLNA